MTPRAPVRFILAAEGKSDFRRIGVLVNHILAARSPEEPLPNAPWHFEPVDGKDYISIKAIPALARECGLSQRYTRGDADSLRRLYHVLKVKKLLSPGTVIIWARDDDGDPKRRNLAIEARSELKSESPILLAVASECGEAWVLAGWTTVLPNPAQETDLRRRLGFHPHEHPQRLSHKEGVPKSAKTVLREVFAGDFNKEAEALIAAADSGSSAARQCGLTAFCEELKACCRT